MVHGDDAPPQRRGQTLAALPLPTVTPPEEDDHDTAPPRRMSEATGQLRLRVAGTRRVRLSGPRATLPTPLPSPLAEGKGSTSSLAVRRESPNLATLRVSAGHSTSPSPGTSPSPQVRQLRKSTPWGSSGRSIMAMGSPLKPGLRRGSGASASSPTKARRGSAAGAGSPTKPAVRRGSASGVNSPTKIALRRGSSSSPLVSPRDRSDIRRRLDAAHAEGRRFRRRVQMPLLALASALFVSSFCFTLVLFDEAHTHGFQLALLPSGPALLVLILAMPTERRAAVKLMLGMLCGCSIATLALLLHVRRQLALWRRGALGLSGFGDVPPWFSALVLLMWLCLLGLGVHEIVRVGWWLRESRGAVVSARACLDAMWVGLGVTLVRVGLTTLALLGAGLAGGLVRTDLAEEAAALWRALLLVGVVNFAVGGGAVLRPDLRMRVQAFLAIRSEAVTAAAGIAALIGRHSSADVQRRAQAHFRAITLDRLTYADMASHSPSRELYARSSPAMFGEVDAFVSHSWTDDASDKWATLQEWRRAFVRTHKREPKLWIDKCCIDQEDVETSLACLPVFLAGCGTLLALVGNTYLQRLWCVVELFVFIEMTGGDLEQIVLCRVDDGFDNSSYEEWLVELGKVDVRNAACKLESDRDRLLGVIQASFGGFDGFNGRLRDVFNAIAASDQYYRSEEAGADSDDEQWTHHQSLLETSWSEDGEDTREGALDWLPPAMKLKLHRSRSI